MKKHLSKMVTIMLAFTMSMVLCTSVYAAQYDEVMPMVIPTTATYKDNCGNTWSFVFFSSGGTKTAEVDTYFELKKVYNSAPATWDEVAAASKTVTNTATVYTLEGGVDSTYCSDQKRFTTASGQFITSYTYMSVVTNISSTHKFSYTYNGVSSTYSKQTSYSYGQ